MKQLLRSAAMVLMAASTVGLLSCSDKDGGDPPKSNTLKIGQSKAKLTTGLISDEPHKEGNTETYYLAILSEGLSSSIEGVNGTGYLVSVAIVCQAGKGVDGTYTFGAASNVDVGKFTTGGWLKRENGLLVDDREFVEGKIKVTKIRDDIYEVSGNVVDADGNTVTFYYKDKFAPMDFGS